MESLKLYIGGACERSHGHPFVYKQNNSVFKMGTIPNEPSSASSKDEVNMLIHHMLLHLHFLEKAVRHQEVK